MIDGKQMYDLAQELFPICRSITGNGVRQTLAILQREVPQLTIHEVPSGTSCFDWTVPNEWNIRDAYVIDPDGKRVIDFSRSNLHVVGYSVPMNADIDLDELQKHLYSLPEKPDAIPYITSYYKEHWGLCLSHNERLKLKPGTYRVVIDSTLAPGSLTYGEYLLSGASSKEIFFSTYVCHPSMANNEVSGPVLACFLAKWLKTLPDRRYSYRFVFIPETIGSIAYLSRHLDTLKKSTLAGFNISCVGDTRCYSYLPSRQGNTPADRVAAHVLSHTDPHYLRYSFLQRGSDEKQYCSPGVDLPVCCIMRSKYGTYPEYHTSLDNLEFISAEGFAGSLLCYQRVIQCLEKNERLQTTVLCEPQMGRRGLYPTTSTGLGRQGSAADMMNILAYADGTKDLLEIAEILGQPLWALLDSVEKLKENRLLEVVGKGGSHESGI